jgi:flagellar motor switch protein FliN/FliY
VTEVLITNDVAALATGAATAALVHLPVSESLTPAPATRDAAAVDIDGQAVVVKLSGSTSGELLIVVGQALVDALQSSPIGSLEVAAALRPALEAAAATIGPVVVGPPQTLPAGAAVTALLAKPDSAVVPLVDGGTVHAVVGLSIVVAPAPRSASANPATSSNSFGAAGMDLLRGVEMDVTAELGRTRMTLNDLLSLHDGAVIELDRAAGAPADLLVNGRLIARGEVVVIDENFGLRITEIVSDNPAR